MPFVALGVLGLALATPPGCTLELPPNDPAGVDAATGAAGDGGGSVGTASGVARSKALANLTFDEASALCDWANQKQGGYGRSVTCSSGRLESTGSSTGSCVTRTLGLGGQCQALTVANIEDCANAAGPDLCQLESAAACSPIWSCMM
jgi:hypothetical protein